MNKTNFTQPQREAMLDLLALGMYADSFLSLAEDESLATTLEELGWDSGTGRTVYLESAISKASRIADEDALHAYLTACADAFPGLSDKQAAYGYLVGFLRVDGMAPEEAPFLQKVREHFSL